MGQTVPAGCPHVKRDAIIRECSVALAHVRRTPGPRGAGMVLHGA
jgi:hypothetical protein